MDIFKKLIEDRKEKEEKKPKPLWEGEEFSDIGDLLKKILQKDTRKTEVTE